MGKRKERTDKNCLNCNAQLQGRYCHICGQENVVTHETVWHLIAHFFQDITHYDGKFFHTLKLLICCPGFLSAEYMRGRRASYLNPVRMYVFTSALFFLIFFTVFNSKSHEAATSLPLDFHGKTIDQINALDSASFADFTSTINAENGQDITPMTRSQFRHYYDSLSALNEAQSEWNLINVLPDSMKTREQYDSLIKTGLLQEGWLTQQLRHKQYELTKRYGGNGRKALLDFGSVFLHKLPQLLFVSLPLLALLLKLLYWRHKRYYYADHGIFSIHYYIFVFIVLLLMIGIGKINHPFDWFLLGLIRLLIGVGIFFYLYKAMRNFYNQRSSVTLLKFLLLCFLFLLIMLLLLLFFLIFSMLSL